MQPLKVKATDLRIGDVVRLNDLPWSTSIVKNIKDNLIHLWRPYGTTADFTYTGGVICYTGTEDYTIPANHLEVDLLERRTLK
jgi:hypothetical protein